MDTRNRYFCIITLVVLSLWLPCLPASAENQPPFFQEIPLPTATLADSEHIELVGHLGGLAQSVATQGNYAYVGFGSEFAVLDISNPASIQRVGWLVAAGEVVDIAIVGDIAYVAYQAGDYLYDIGRTGLQVIDIQNPNLPISITIQEFTGCGSNARIITANPYAYLAYTACSAFGGIIQNNGAYLYKLDISEPTNPSIITSTNYFMSSFAELASMNGILYALWGDISGAYLKVFDTTASSELVELNTIQVAGGSNAIALSSDYAFLAASDNGIQVVEISDPYNPSPVITHTLPGTAQDIFIADNLAYLAAGEAGLQIVDISDPLNPLDSGSYAANGSSMKVFISQGYAYLASGWGGFEIVQLTNLTQAGLLELPQNINDLAIRDPYAYISAEDGFWILDLTDPSLPLGISYTPSISRCSSLVIKENYAYNACELVLHIINISNPHAPSESGIYDLPGDVQEMTLVNQTMYVAGSGLLILDISDPLSPVEVSTFSIDDHDVNAVAVSGGYAYLGLDNGNLMIVDISDPSTPTGIGFYDPPDRYSLRQEATAIQVQGAVAYLTTVEPPPSPLAGYYAGDTWLINVSDPDTPTLISSISPYGAPFDVDVENNTVVIAYEREGLRLYDITNPAAPLERGNFNPSEYIYGVDLTDEIVYLYNNSLFLTQYISSTTHIFLPAMPQLFIDN